MKRLSLLVLLVLCGTLSTPLAAETPMKEWTWMVFLNADNNLDKYGVRDQEEMAAVGSNEALNIVTLIDRFKAPASFNYIEKGSVVPLKDMGELDMGDWRLLVSFVRDVKARFPARHYALIIWNHGSGWDKKTRIPAYRGISYDDSSNNHITTNQLGQALGEIKTILGKNLDILGMDACLMQMFEVGWAVHTSCDLIAASEETEPAEGYPYTPILSFVTANTSPEALAKKIVSAYAASYQHDTDEGEDAFSRPRKTTQSVVVCAKLPDLKIALDEFAGAAIKGRFAPQFREALGQVQRFSTYSNCDLLDLVKLLKESIADAAFKAAAKNLETALTATVIANATTGENEDPEDPGYPDGGDDLHAKWRSPLAANGLSIYFPEASGNFSKEYANLSFAKESIWDEMVQDYYNKRQITRITEDVLLGDLTGLRDFLSLETAPNQETINELTLHLNFSLWCEQPHPGKTTEELRALLKTLGNR